MPQHNQSLLEQELKAEKLPVGLPWRILLLAIIVFSAMVFIYLGMLLGYRPYLNSQIKKVEQEISELNKKIDEGEQKNLTEFYSQLANIQKLFNSHIAASNIFDFLEENTHQDVYFISMDLSIKDREVKLAGLSSSYKVLAEQLELLRLSHQTEQVFLKDSQLKEGSVSFIIDLILKPEIFSL
ncbi:MAG: PilN domain-containing protein [Candidatus Paceibacterota bacterium]